MDLSARGKKRRCLECEEAFYDLNRDPAPCPHCGHMHPLEIFTIGKRPPPPAKPAVADDEDEDDDDVIDEDDDDAVIGDDDLDDDDDDEITKVGAVPSPDDDD